VAVAESAPQADTRFVCVIRTTVGQHFNWYIASRGSLGDCWAFCLIPKIFVKFLWDHPNEGDKCRWDKYKLHLRVFWLKSSTAEKLCPNERWRCAERRWRKASRCYNVGRRRSLFMTLTAPFRR